MKHEELIWKLMPMMKGFCYSATQQQLIIIIASASYGVFLKCSLLIPHPTFSKNQYSENQNKTTIIVLNCLPQFTASLDI